MIYQLSILNQTVGYLFAKSVVNTFLRLKDINTAGHEKQIVELENNYRLKPLLKNQLRKHQLVKEVLEDSKELIA